TPIAAVGNHILRQASQLPLDPLQMRNQTTRVAWPLMHTEPHHELAFGPHLQVVAGLQLPISHVVILHPHEGRIDIGLGIAVAPGELSLLVFVLLLTRQAVRFQLLQSLLGFLERGLPPAAALLLRFGWLILWGWWFWLDILGWRLWRFFGLGFQTLVQLLDLLLQFPAVQRLLRSQLFQVPFS